MDYLLGYCYDELNQIELCLRQIDDDPNHYNPETGLHYNDDGTINNDWIEPSRRIKNFHTLINMIIKIKMELSTL